MPILVKGIQLSERRCFRLFEKSLVQHRYYELNISCPNTFGGEPFTSPQRLEILLTCLDRLRLSRPVLIKMPVDLTNRAALNLLRVSERHQVAGVIFGNLTKDKNNPAVDPADRRLWRTRKGNLGGKPTWDRSNRLIVLTKKYFPQRFVIVGTGGIFSPADAAHKLNIGADLIQLITGMIYQGPSLIGQINYHLANH